MLGFLSIRPDYLLVWPIMSEIGLVKDAWHSLLKHRVMSCLCCQIYCHIKAATGNWVLNNLDRFCMKIDLNN